MKKMLSTLTAIACAGAAFGAGEMFPFVPSYDAPDNVVNMSHLLVAPAGNGGRIRIEGGHFVNRSSFGKCPASFNQCAK